MLKCQGTTWLDGGAEKRLLHRRRNWIDDGHGWLMDEVDDGLGESAQEDVDDSLFEGGDGVRDYDSEDGGGESSENRENVNPK